MNKTETARKKQKRHFLKNILNVAVYMFIAVIVVFIIIISSMRADNQIYMFFGYSIAVIQSDSMSAGGFYSGDKVVLQKVDVDDLRVGEIIVFYKFVDNCDLGLPKYDISDIINEYKKPEIDEIPEIFNQRTSFSEISSNKNNIFIFHRITAILVDDYGVKFFKTKGDTAGSCDPFLIREDCVVGKYCETTKVLNFFLKLTSTPLGMIALMLVPILILVAFQINLLITVFAIFLITKKLYNRKFDISENKFLKYNLSDHLTNLEKLFIFDIAQNENKLKVANLIWQNDFNFVDSQLNLEKLIYSLELYLKNRNDFWDFWLENENDIKQKKKLKIFRLQADLMINYNFDYKTVKIKAKELYKRSSQNV